MEENAVLVVGAGIAGLEASLILADAERKVYLVEKESYIGGNVIKCEEIFSNMECSTCMIAPKQQEVLQNENIHIHTLAEVAEVKESGRNFRVKIKKKARYVSQENCIGCNECFGACPVDVANEFEEKLGQRKAIYTPCAGALPNVPRIDVENCLRFKNQECQACREACMFEAIDFDDKDEKLEKEVGAVILATGFVPMYPQNMKRYGYGLEDVYTAMEFERMHASNGPTEGNILLKSGDPPKSAVVIHGNGTQNASSSLCTMYALKFIHYLKEKVPEIELTEFYTEICVPGKLYQKFYEKTEKLGAVMIRANDIEVSQNDRKKLIRYTTGSEEKKSIEADMIILTTPIGPHDDASRTAGIFGIELAENGFFANREDELSSVVTSKPGIFVAGCAQGPKDIQETVLQSAAAAGRILSYATRGRNR